MTEDVDNSRVGRMADLWTLARIPFERKVGRRE